LTRPRVIIAYGRFGRQWRPVCRINDVFSSDFWIIIALMNIGGAIPGLLDVACLGWPDIQP